MQKTGGNEVLTIGIVVSPISALVGCPSTERSGIINGDGTRERWSWRCHAENYGVRVILAEAYPGQSALQAGGGGIDGTSAELNRAMLLGTGSGYAFACPPLFFLSAPAPALAAPTYTPHLPRRSLCLLNIHP